MIISSVGLAGEEHTHQGRSGCTSCWETTWFVNVTHVKNWPSFRE